MNEQEKAAYILGLKKAIEQIEAEGEMVSAEYSDRTLLLMAAENALSNAVFLIQDEIAMMEGTRETED